MTFGLAFRPLDALGLAGVALAAAPRAMAEGSVEKGRDLFGDLCSSRTHRVFPATPRGSASGSTPRPTRRAFSSGP